jgi:regulator of sigma E protease
MGVIENLVSFVFVLGVMVLIHELGHFLAARYFNVRVEAFSIGFGPRLFGFKRGDTDYKVCLLPLGGFVKMAGENVGEPSRDPDEFVAKPRWQRMIIAVMGPVFNVILALVLLAGLFMVRYQRLAFELEPPRIGYVADHSAASRAGIQAGDLIVSIDGDETPAWENVRLIEIASPLKTLRVTVERDGKQLELPITLEADKINGIGDSGWSEQTPVRLGQTVPGLPAEKAGIENGDILKTLNGEAVNSWRQVPDSIQRSRDQLIELEVLRNETLVKLQLTPIYDTSDAESPAWRIGVELRPDYKRISTSLGFTEAVEQSVDYNVKNATLIFGFLRGLLEQRMSPKSLSGPIGIAQMSGEAARAGWPALIMLMAAISLNLGIFNLLPIPILDGGMITVLLLESLIRRDISIAVKERIVQVGLVFLMMLFAFVIYNDILKSLPPG